MLISFLFNDFKRSSIINAARLKASFVLRELKDGLTFTLGFANVGFVRRY